MNERKPISSHIKSTTTFKITFLSQRKVEFGRGLYVVGNLPELGQWDPRQSIKLFWTEGDHWTQTVSFKLPTHKSTTIEYKVIATNYSRVDLADLEWEQGPNRVIEVAGAGSSSSFIEGDTPQRAPSDSEPSTPTSSRGSLHQVIDCKSKASVDIFNQAMERSNVEFLTLQNADAKTVREVGRLLPMYMTYYAEDCDGSVCPILYKFSHWRFVKGKTYNIGSSQLASWAMFCNGNTQMIVGNLVSDGSCPEELVLSDLREYFQVRETLFNLNLVNLQTSGIPVKFSERLMHSERFIPMKTGTKIEVEH